MSRDDGPSRSGGRTRFPVPSAAEVSARLTVLRRISVLEREEEARSQRLSAPAVATPSFEHQVAQRLRELRALCALASHLHRRAKPGS